MSINTYKLEFTIKPTDEVKLVGNRPLDNMEQISEVLTYLDEDRKKSFLNDIQIVCEKYGIFFEKLTDIHFNSVNISTLKFPSSTTSSLNPELPSSLNTELPSSLNTELPSSLNTELPSSRFSRTSPCSWSTTSSISSFMTSNTSKECDKNIDEIKESSGESSIDENSYPLDTKLVGILFNITEKDVILSNRLCGLKITDDYVKKFKKFKLSKYEIYANKEDTDCFVIKHNEILSEIYINFTTKKWCQHLYEFLIDCEETISRKSDFSTKTHVELYDEFALAYSQKCIDKLNNIMEVGRQTFPKYFNRNSDNIVGRYLAGDMGAVEELSKQILEEVDNRKARSKYVSVNEIDMGPSELLESFSRAYIDKDFENFSATLDVGCKMWKDVFNKDMDNIIGYFLRKEYDKVEYCAKELKKKTPITMEQATKLYEKYTKNKAQDLETYTQFYPLRDMFGFPHFWKPDSGEELLHECWGNLKKDMKICAKCMMG